MKTIKANTWNLYIKNSFIAAMVIFTAMSCTAMNYQIKYLNTPTITINKKQMKIGDWFSDRSIIQWDSDSQAMRVLSQDNKTYTISAISHKRSKAKKLSDYLTNIKPMGVRDHGGWAKNLNSVFENKYEILDELHIDISDISDLPQDLIIVISGKQPDSSSLALQPKDGIITISRDEIEPLLNADQPVLLRVTCEHPTNPKSLHLTDWFSLTPLPLALDF